MDTLTVTALPAQIDSNFATIRAQLEQHLADYAAEVVTADTVKAAKARATEINKLSGEIKARVKAAVDEASAPITAFKDQGKGLQTMCQDVRQRILDQVDIFEAETLNLCAKLLDGYLQKLYEKHEVRQEFRTIDLVGWPKLSWVTTTGNLSAAAKKEVESAVGERLNLQLRTDNRLSRLENESHRAGLHSYLTREHVEGILFASDDEYIAGLERLVARELERQEATERKAREKIEQEQAERAVQAAEEDARRTQEAAEARAAAEPAETEGSSTEEPDPGAGGDPDPEPDPVPLAAEAEQSAPDAGTHRFQVTVHMEVEVPEQVTGAQVQKQLVDKLRAAGVDRSIRDIQVRRAPQAEAA